MDFVSPESIGPCIELTEEFRELPKNHRAKEDKLEVILPEIPSFIGKVFVHDPATLTHQE